MQNNLFISYDLYKNGQNYDGLISKIKSLGNSANVNKSVWYLKTAQNEEQTLDQLKPYFDDNDRVVVINATSNSAAWSNLGASVTDHLQKFWLK